MDKIAVIGTTSWGITLSMVLATKGSEVRLWARTLREANKIKKNGTDRFPDVVLPEEITITHHMDEALKGAAGVILAVPSSTMRKNIKLVTPHLTKSMVIISASKGLEIGTNKRMSEIIAEEISPKYAGNICVISGPQIASEIVHHHPAAAVVASEDKNSARKAQKLLAGENFCVFTTEDIIGVELGGALKNILALGAGIADGLGYGDNAKAAFMTRGLTEITALGMALGANPLTFSGLAGLGDVITTCQSPLSRNHYVGTELAKGRKLSTILKSMRQVAEGVNTTLVAHNIAKQMGLEKPITQQIYQVLYEDAEPEQAALNLIGGNTRHELSGRRWKLFSLFRQKKKTPAVSGD